MPAWASGVGQDQGLSWPARHWPVVAAPSAWPPVSNFPGLANGEIRAEFAVAAIGHYIQKNPVSVPDLGSVRDELAMLLQEFSERGVSTVTKIVFSMRDYFVETNSSLADLRSKLEGRRTIEEVLRRGVRRGEIDPSKLTKRIASLPLDLGRHEVFMTHKPIPKAVIAEILDTFFLPLVATKKMPRPRRAAPRQHR
jgi:hypothetical protein